VKNEEKDGLNQRRGRDNNIKMGLRKQNLSDSGQK
jgi:hypothetical protein